MSKPNKFNRVMCPDCGRAKMLFKNESKANNFIKWNGNKLNAYGGVLRPYYCPACCGWHITHKEHNEEYDHRTEKLINAYNRLKNIEKIEVVSKEKILINVNDVELAEEVWKTIPQEIKEKLSKTYLKKLCHKISSIIG